MRQLSIDQLDNEGRRVSIYDKGTPESKTPMFQRTVSMPGAHKRVIHELLRPRQWKPNHEDRRFMLAVSLSILKDCVCQLLPSMMGNLPKQAVSFHWGIETHPVMSYTQWSAWDSVQVINLLWHSNILHHSMLG